MRGQVIHSRGQLLLMHFLFRPSDASAREPTLRHAVLYSEWRIFAV